MFVILFKRKGLSRKTSPGLSGNGLGNDILVWSWDLGFGVNVLILFLKKRSCLVMPVSTKESQTYL